MLIYVFALLVGALGLATVFGIRGVCYVMGDDDWTIGAIAFFVGGLFTLFGLGFTIAGYSSLAGRENAAALALSAGVTAFGAAIILWQFHKTSRKRRLASCR